MMFSSQTAFYLASLVSYTIVNAYHDISSYVPYPPEAKDLLTNNTLALKDKTPKVHALATLPGPDDLFDHMQEVAVRNSYEYALFDLDVSYIMEDGMNNGCRFPNDKDAAANATGRVTDHSPAVGAHKEMCDTHCTHAGRYCPVFSKEALTSKTKQPGQELVLEVLRRLCFGSLVENKFANPMWFQYLKTFKDKDCMNSDSLSDCSKKIFQSTLTDFNADDDSDFGKCVAEADAKTDTTNPILEASLDFSATMEYDVERVSRHSVLEFNGRSFTGKYRADFIENAWCEAFIPTGDLRPVSCDFCKTCNNAKNCLWSLQCDNHGFYVETYKDPKHKIKTTSPPVPETPLQIVEEQVVRGTGEILAFGIGIGFLAAAALWIGVEIKRKRAVAEVKGELPENGFRDSSAGDVEDVELPEVA